MRLSHRIPSFVLFALSLARYVVTSEGDALTHYSTWMASSIISRGDGLLKGEGDKSALLQAGFVQKVFRHLIEQYPNNPRAALFRDYIRKSVDSC